MCAERGVWVMPPYGFAQEKVAQPGQPAKPFTTNNTDWAGALWTLRGAAARVGAQSPWGPGPNCFPPTASASAGPGLGAHAAAFPEGLPPWAAASDQVPLGWLPFLPCRVDSRLGRAEQSRTSFLRGKGFRVGVGSPPLVTPWAPILETLGPGFLAWKLPEPRALALLASGFLT